MSYHSHLQTPTNFIITFSCDQGGIKAFLLTDRGREWAIETAKGVIARDLPCYTSLKFEEFETYDVNTVRIQHPEGSIWE